MFSYIKFSSYILTIKDSLKQKTLTMKITTVLLIFLLTISLAYSKFTETIDSDRPGQSISPLTVGKQVLQVQTGFNYFNNSSYDGLTINSYSNITNVRYGLLESLELNGTLGYRINVNDYREKSRSNLVSSGFERMKLGTRVNILNEKGLTPKIAVNAELIFAYSNEVYSFIKNGYELKLSVRQPLSEKLSLTSNVGIFNNPIFPIFFYPYTLNISYNINDELFAFAEIYGLLNKEVTVNYNGGLGYYLNNNLLLDLSGGIEKEIETYNWFLDAGISFRFLGNAK